VAIKGSQTSEIGTFTYTQSPPPADVTATPGSQSFTAPFTVTLTSTGGAVPASAIYYTLDGSNPSVGGSGTLVYSGPIAISSTTQIRAMARSAAGVNSAVTVFNYTEDGGTEPPVAAPAAPSEFETTLNVTMTSATPGATIYYTLNGTTPTTSSTQYTGPLSLVSTTTIKAFATLAGEDSVVVEFTYTKTGPVCPELTSGNFGWIDYSGGSNSNADLKNEIENPEVADSSWYYENCAGSADTNCRDPHDPIDAADDHWLVEGTPGHRDSSLGLVCDLYLGQIIYVPIWDDFHLLPSKKPNGNNAVFHIIGFAAFRLDGIIDNKNNGDPSNDACGDGMGVGKPNDKGFVGTYVDSFVGTQVAPCLPSADGTNPCQNLQNDRLEINLAD
jgi:Chitobiase/beta-hexosaminidase C-terminal domain